MNGANTKALDKERIMSTYNRYDMVAERGEGALCYDKEGREYVDFTAGIGVNSLGYCDEGWVNAVVEQIRKLQHVSNLFYSEPQVQVAQMLTDRTGMKKVFFGNSGAEANEAAIKVARKYGATEKGVESYKIISLKNSFHGRTMAAITATGQENYHKYFTPFLEGFLYCEAGNIEELDRLATDEICAVMMEMVQGEGGVVNQDEAFVREAMRLCNERKILFIADEVQTGIGRCGRFFAYENYGIKPDIVTFAKGIGGGLPIGGALYGERCCNVFEPGDHGTTYGGNPVACAGAVEVLKRVDENFLEEVRKKGDYIKAQLMEMEQIEEVSGMGLMIGAKVKGDKEAKEIVKTALEDGLMILTAKDKIRMLPPLIISYKEIDKGLEIFRNAIK